MRDRDHSEFSPDPIRANVLASAIILRVCSLRPEVSAPVRRACRAGMRAQANKWRQMPGNGAAAPG